MAMGGTLEYWGTLTPPTSTNCLTGPPPDALDAAAASAGGAVGAGVKLGEGAIRVFEKAFDSVSVNVRYREPSGNVSVFVVRSPEESYSGLLAFDEEGDTLTFHLDELVFRFPDER